MAYAKQTNIGQHRHNLQPCLHSSGVAQSCDHVQRQHTYGWCPQPRQLASCLHARKPLCRRNKRLVPACTPTPPSGRSTADGFVLFSFDETEQQQQQLSQGTHQQSTAQEKHTGSHPSEKLSIVQSHDIQEDIRQLAQHEHRQEVSNVIQHNQQAQPATQSETQNASPDEAKPLSSPVKPDSRPSKPSFSQSQQRSQMRGASLLLLVPIIVYSMHFSAAVLDIVQSCSLVSVLGLHSLVDALAGGQDGSIAGVPGEDAGSEFLNPDGDVTQPGEDDTALSNGKDDGSPADLPDGVAGKLVAALVSLQGWLLELWNKAFDLQSSLETGLTWWHSDAVGLMIQKVMNINIGIWMLMKLGSFDPVISIVPVILAHTKDRVLEVLKGQSSTSGNVADKQSINARQDSRQISKLENSNLQTGAQGSQQSAQLTVAMTTSGSSSATLAVEGSTISETSLYQSYVSPAADTMIRVALALCAASACMTPVSWESGFGAVLSIAAFCLTGVQLIAAVMYFWKAWSPECVRFYTKHSQEIIQQALWLFTCQAALQVVIVYHSFETLDLTSFDFPRILATNDSVFRTWIPCRMIASALCRIALLSAWHVSGKRWFVLSTLAFLQFPMALTNGFLVCIVFFSFLHSWFASRDKH